MLDTAKIREEFHISRLVVSLCNEVDRISELHGYAHSALVTANNRVGRLKEEVKQLREACQAVVDVAEYADSLSVEVAVISARKLCSDVLL